MKISVIILLISRGFLRPAAVTALGEYIANLPVSYVPPELNKHFIHIIFFTICTSLLYVNFAN
jgi:hypothetical protein